MFKMLFNSFFFYSRKGGKGLLLAGGGRGAAFPPFVLPTLHSSFILPGSSAYIPCAVRGVQESFMQAPL